jgi:hypothetical protein
MRTLKSIQHPLYAPLKKAFGVAMAQQALIDSNGPKQEIRKVVRWSQNFLKQFPERFARHANIRFHGDRLKGELCAGALCEMMVQPRGRLDGSGYIAAILLKILIIAYLEAKDDRLPFSFATWRTAAEKDPATPDLRTAISGYEREFSDALVSLFRALPEGRRSLFTELCRPCVEAMIESEATGLPKSVARQLFGGELVATLTSKSSDAMRKTNRANSLSKLGKALQCKVKFLREGGRKND